MRHSNKKSSVNEYENTSRQDDKTKSSGKNRYIMKKESGLSKHAVSIQNVDLPSQRKSNLDSKFMSRDKSISAQKSKKVEIAKVSSVNFDSMNPLRDSHE